mmetsp:Transcript_41742/g.109956  ORF Transcript_41742/g.109956 Transcript_41742/m.109956 type:complete len:235 (-) Transcript_41742:1793-2497(-)
MRHLSGESTTYIIPETVNDSASRKHKHLIRLCSGSHRLHERTAMRFESTATAQRIMNTPDHLRALALCRHLCRQCMTIHRSCTLQSSRRSFKIQFRSVGLEQPVKNQRKEPCVAGGNGLESILEILILQLRREEIRMQQLLSSRPLFGLVLHHLPDQLTLSRMVLFKLGRKFAVPHIPQRCQTVGQGWQRMPEFKEYESKRVDISFLIVRELHPSNECRSLLRAAVQRCTNASR